MRQYLELLKEIKNKGTYKPAARENMPGTLSLFGYQFRHNLAYGFPLLTTKKMYFKPLVTELLWFLKGDTNIKYLVDNGCNWWNEDAYNYYCKIYNEKPKDYIKSFNIDRSSASTEILSFENFINEIKQLNFDKLTTDESGYRLGDCGYQYGKVWRKWGKYSSEWSDKSESLLLIEKPIDQIANLIKGLKEHPESRRHILTAIDPAHDTDLALYWCHCLVQFNCRPLTNGERKRLYTYTLGFGEEGDKIWGKKRTNEVFEGEVEIWDIANVPKYYLDCQLYQRSCDVVLGVPYNIASYALLTEIFAKICNMIPGEYIHTFGDVHIYDNHKEQVEEQLKREPTELPKLVHNIENQDWWEMIGLKGNFSRVTNKDFELQNYNPQPAISAELSTGLVKPTVTKERFIDHSLDSSLPKEQ